MEMRTAMSADLKGLSESVGEINTVAITPLGGTRDIRTPHTKTLVMLMSAL